MRDAAVFGLAFAVGFAWSFADRCAFARASSRVICRGMASRPLEEAVVAGRRFGAGGR
jgi:hypothetical protein